MRKTLNNLRNFARDEEGVALIEYTVLLGVLLVAVVATMGLVAGWVKGNWTTFCNSVGAATSGATC
jgi:pilus assembly protein Flp/PilA